MLSKKDIKLIAIIIGISLVIWIGYTVMRPKGPSIEVIHGNTVVERLEPKVDGRYTIQGSYGELVVEVKDGKFRITDEECPNHVCSAMGWVESDGYLPILCLPNEVMVGMEGQFDE